MGISPEFRTRSTDMLDEQEAFTCFGAQFLRPESAFLAIDGQKPTPARRAMITIARGHMAFLREHGIRISCGIPYGSLFDTTSPGLRNVLRWGDKSDADVLFIFQSDRIPQFLGKQFIKSEPAGFTYHTHLALPANPYISGLNVTGVSPGHIRHSLNELHRLLNIAQKGEQRVRIPLQGNATTVSIHYAIEKKKWLLDAMSVRAFCGSIPKNLISDYRRTERTYAAYQSTI